MSIFRPDIKPPQWGPLSAVQYAVRANAERLGVGDLRAISPCQDGLLDNILASPGTGLLRGSGAKPVGYYQEFAKTAENVDNSCYTNSAANLNSRQLTFFGVFRQRSLPAAYTTSPLQVGIHTWAGGNGNSFRVRIAANGTAEIRAEGNSSWRIGAAATIALGSWYAVAATVNADSHLSFRFALKNLDSGGVVLNRSNIYNANIPTFSPVGYGLGCCFEYERNYDTDTDVAFFGASASLVSESTVLTLVEQPYALLMPVSRPVYFDLGGGGGTYQLTATPGIVASTSSSLFNILRDVQASTSGLTVTSNSSLGIKADLQAATIANYATSNSFVSLNKSLTATSGVTATVSIVVAAVLKEVSSNTITTVNTNQILVNLLKNLIVSSGSVTTTGQLTANIKRDFSTTTNTSVNTNNITLLLSGFIELIATASINYTTNNTTLTAIRQLTTSVGVTSTTSTVTVLLEALIELIASAATQTNTSFTKLLNKRDISASTNATIQSQNIALNIARELVILAQSGSVTSNIQVILSSLLEFIANASVNAETSNTALSLVRSLTASVNSCVTLDNALVDVYRELGATTNTQTTTAAMHLVLSGIAAITDTLIFSKTINRNIYSKTVNRIITQV